MLYLNQPIITSEAEILIVPCGLDGLIEPDTLQWDVSQFYGVSYDKEFHEDLEAEMIEVGKPGMYKNPDTDQIVINFPIRDAAGNGIILTEIISQMREITQFVAQSKSITTIAVPPLGKDYSWEHVENMCQRFENLYGDRGVEFWLYPPDDVEDEPVGDEEVEVVRDVIAERLGVTV
jgi:hypothetical protein